MLLKVMGKNDGKEYHLKYGQVLKNYSPILFLMETRCLDSGTCPGLSIWTLSSLI